MSAAILLTGAAVTNFVSAQVNVVEDPITTAQQTAAKHAPIPAILTHTGTSVIALDPITAAQVLAAAERTFPNLSADIEAAGLLRKAVSDPVLRGSLRGRIAEEDWISRNAKDGWRKVANPNAPQNDAVRYVNGKLEGAQVKVYADWHDYLRSMRQDDKAERFVLPDDHYLSVKTELETRKAGAIRGGLAEKAAAYAHDQQRLTKYGRTFEELDSALESFARHYGRVKTAMRAAGKTASFVAITLAILDGGIAVYEVATGKAEVDELLKRLGKTAVGGTASWALGDAAAAAAVAAGATGAVPIAVAIVVGTATYLVVDWAVDSVAAR